MEDRKARTMSRYDDIVKYDNKEGKAASKGAQRHIQWLKDKEALYETPKHYDLLDQAHDRLWDDFDNLRKDFGGLEKSYAALQTENERLRLQIQDLEDEKKKQKRRYEILEQEYEEQKQEYVEQTQQYEKLLRENQALVKKNQEATANNPKSAGGDSKKSYVQWIQSYTGLLGDYGIKVLDVVSDARETIDALRRLVINILDYGFCSDAVEEDVKRTIYDYADKYLLPEYRNPETLEYREFHSFFDDMLDLASSAEKYRESFYLVKDFVETRFDTKYARQLDCVNPKNQDDNGKKIARCYLPAVLFFFDVDHLAACAPGLVDVEEEKKSEEERAASSPSGERYSWTGEFTNSPGQKSSQRGAATRTTSISTSSNNNRQQLGKK